MAIGQISKKSEQIIEYLRTTQEGDLVTRQMLVNNVPGFDPDRDVSRLHNTVFRKLRDDYSIVFVGIRSDKRRGQTGGWLNAGDSVKLSYIDTLNERGMKQAERMRRTCEAVDRDQLSDHDQRQLDRYRTIAQAAHYIAAQDQAPKIIGLVAARGDSLEPSEFLREMVEATRRKPRPAGPTPHAPGATP